ncbi:MAG: hypothetical protein IVW54_12030 [Candidatus Binataceae bacterium]|nr:hypothetical protein [Candidatus Binataceae bacterium]
MKASLCSEMAANNFALGRTAESLVGFRGRDAEAFFRTSSWNAGKKSSKASRRTPELSHFLKPGALYSEFIMPPDDLVRQLAVFFFFLMA